MKWKSKKNELERLINEEKVSYEEIGRKYGVSGAAIKKAAERLGINLPKRRKVNPSETFNKGTAKVGKCLNCGKEFVLYKSTNSKFCSSECMGKFKHKEILSKWKNGEYAYTASFSTPKFIKKYMYEKANYKCEKCGFSGTNPYTGKTILQIHHIDGNCLNNDESNLQVLCPNCHAMTENFGSRNKNATPGRSRYFGRSN